MTSPAAPLQNALALTACVALALPTVATAQQPQRCEQVFFDAATSEPTTVSVLLTAPLPGARLRAFAPDCPSTVEGIASTVGIPARFDFYVVIDLSGSTNDSSGVDVDGDGVADEARGSADSIFAAELAAARRFLEVLDFNHHRVSLVGFYSRARVLHGLSDDRESLRASLDGLEPPTLHAQTNFGMPFELLLAEHAAAHDPEREQVVLFLSDGAPNVVWAPPADPVSCWRRDSECTGIQWAAEAASRGLVVNTYAVGTRASTAVLAEMARAGGGDMERLNVAGEIIEALPRSSHVGIAEVRVENLTTGARISVQTGPDGAFVAPMEFRDGENEILVTVVAEHEENWSVTCASTLEAHCLEVSCPDALQLECEGGGARVAGFAAWANDAAVRISHDRGEGADASGDYPLGETVVVWTFEDDEAGMTRCTSTVEVSDTLAPRLEQPRRVVEASCGSLPEAPALRAEDACDPSPRVDFSEQRVDGACPDSFELLRDWTATDASGLTSSASQRVIVRDDLAPELLGAPADATVSCVAVPPAAELKALDDCDPSPRVEFSETRVDGRCAGTYSLRRRWLALDRCGNAVEHLQTVQVVDDEPPVLVPRAENSICLSARNHQLLRIDASEFAPTVLDGCSNEATWRVEACLSDQPDDGLGDGSTDADCQVGGDGRSLLVRTERQGSGATGHRGRSYTVLAVAEDPCGNLSAPTPIAFVAVRHDQSGHDGTCR